MVQSIQYTDVLEAVTCGECRIPFGMPSRMIADRRKDGQDFWCPNGHKIHYLESENTVLRQQRDLLRQQVEWARAAARAARDQADAAERSRAAVKGHLTRTRKRIAAGVCPCCTRSFTNLARHMASQHPSFNGGDTPERAGS